MIPARAETRDSLYWLADRNGSSAVDELERIIKSAREERLLALLSSSLADGPTVDDDFSGW